MHWILFLFFIIFSVFSEKTKWNFDWDAEDDTSQDVNPLYKSKAEIRPQFGRGFIAGVDHTSQLDEYKKYVK